jgi:cell division protein FtsN
MNRSFGRASSGLVFFAVAMIAASVVAGLGEGRAQAMQISPQQKQEMKSHYEKATRAYDVGKYQEAIEEYQKAYEIGGDPPMLYNIAQAYRLNDQPSEAVRFYRRYLQRSPNARNREDVERKIAELEKVVEERKKAAAASPPPPPQPVTPPPAPVTPVAPAPATAPVVTTPLAPPPEEPRHASRARKAVGWSLIGAGVLAGGGAAYFAQVGKSKSDKISADSRASTPMTFDPSVEQSGKNANVFAIVLASVAGAAVITGTIVLLTGGSASSEPGTASAQATLSPWIGPAGPGGGTVVGAGAGLVF